MKVFITGGTGYVGSVLVEQFVGAGHQVAALARSERSATALGQAGAEVVHGDLADVDVLEAAAAQADAVVHTAVDYTMTPEAVETELAAVSALLRGASGGARPFVYTSTGLVYGFDAEQSRDEDADLPEASAQPVKVAAEQLVLAADVAGVVVRAGLVHGRGGSGLVTGLVQAAAASGTAAFVGAGDNAWNPVHVDDLARLYVAALENPVPGVYNAVGSTSFTFRGLAEAIADLTGGVSNSISAEEAAATFGPMAVVLQTTATMSSAKARRTFGWTPTGPSLVDDVRSGSYRAPAPKALLDRSAS